MPYELNYINPTNPTIPSLLLTSTCHPVSKNLKSSLTTIRSIHELFPIAKNIFSPSHSHALKSLRQINFQTVDDRMKINLLANNPKIFLSGLSLHQYTTKKLSHNQLPEEQIHPIKKFISNTREGIGKWKKDEHERFLKGIKIYPNHNWRNVAIVVRTRNPTQVRTHAQKYFKKIERRQRGLIKRGRKRSEYHLNNNRETQILDSGYLSSKSSVDSYIIE